MGFGNAKRMEMLKDVMKDEKKKKLAKKKAVRRTSSSASMSSGAVSSRSSVSGQSQSTNGSSVGADDPFHIRRVMKVQKLWDKVKKDNTPEALGAAFLDQVMPNTHTEQQGKVLVETLDCLISLMGPDMEEVDFDDMVASLEKQGIDAGAIGEEFADCMNALCNGALPQKDIDTLDKTIGLVLREFFAAN